MTIGAPPSLRVVKLDSARPHVTAPACCAACQHEWVAVAPAGAGGEGPRELECPACASLTDAVQHAKVRVALQVLDDLREKLRTGQIVAFCGVGVEADDTTMMWATATENVSRLRMMGALRHLEHSYAHDVIPDFNPVLKPTGDGS